MSLTPSHLIEYLYCPRFTYFEYVLGIPQNEEKDYKVMRGRNLHDDRLEQNKDYLRRRIGVVGKHLDQYLTNEQIRGRIDEVLELNDGTMAPLDYKFAEYKERIYDTYRTQLYCYAWLIQENFSRPVNRGFLVYTRSRNKLIEVPIAENDLQYIQKTADAVYDIINRNFYPKGTKNKASCVTCTYRNVCIR